MTCHSTVNRWNPLEWVGVVWSLLCLLIHACLSCLLLLRAESGLIHRGWIRGVWTCPTMCELSVWTRFGKGSGERPCRSTWWVVSLKPSLGTEFCVFQCCSPSVDVVPTMWSLTLMKTQCYLQKCQASKTPLFIPIKSHSLAPALFYCIRTTSIHLLLAAVAEPLYPLHDPSLPQ